MRKPHLPDENGATVTVLARRLDDVETRLLPVKALTRDVAAVGRGLADLTAQVRALTEATNRGILTAPNRLPTRGGADPDDASGPFADGVGEGAAQPNWLTVTDPDLAGQWLADAVEFVAGTLSWFLPLGLPACWPLHPTAVTEIVALQRQYVTAYDGQNPAAVSELLGRWLPGTVRRLKGFTSGCDSRSGHIEGKHVYQVPHLDPHRVALWWTESRGEQPPASVAFAMTRIP